LRQRIETAVLEPIEIETLERGLLGGPSGRHRRIVVMFEELCEHHGRSGQNRHWREQRQTHHAQAYLMA